MILQRRSRLAASDVRRGAGAGVRGGAADGHEDQHRHQYEQERDGDEGPHAGDRPAPCRLVPGGSDSVRGAPSFLVSLVKIENIDASRGSSLAGRSLSSPAPVAGLPARSPPSTARDRPGETSEAWGRVTGRPPGSGHACSDRRVAEGPLIHDPLRLFPVLRGVMPSDLVRQARLAEEAGFDALWISDHFHPWLYEQGQAGYVWSVIGAISRSRPCRSRRR